MKKYYLIIILAVLIMLGILFAIRVISGEDNWVCKNGEWIKHGNPSEDMPSENCSK